MRIQLIIEIRSAPTNAAVKLSTEKPLIIPLPRYQNIAPLITKEKRPRVRILSGNVRILMIGFKNIFTSVRQAPTIKATHIGSTMTPETICVVAHTATERIIQCKIILIYFFTLTCLILYVIIFKINYRQLLLPTLHQPCL